MNPGRLLEQPLAKSVSQLRTEIRQDLLNCRNYTFKLLEEVDYDTLCRQAHPEFSPVGWHLGHIAYIESHWILGKCAGLSSQSQYTQYNRLFAADGLPKYQRVALPGFDEICEYLNNVRDRTLIYLEQLEQVALTDQERLWRWLIQHESQHIETIAMVLQMLGKCQKSTDSTSLNLESEMIKIPRGYFWQGNNAIEALDNENSVHSVYLDDYWIDRYAVTTGQFQQFMDADGYGQKVWWSEAGWQWLNSPLNGQAGEKIKTPFYWKYQKEHNPLWGVSWYEADAYARFRGLRLPTESEWEKASSSLPMLGEVWQWTSTLFSPYPNFQHFPYAGYSSVYFDDRHYVLKGGSWATPIYGLRPSFRNWYQPQIRQVFSGFRCAKNYGHRHDS